MSFCFGSLGVDGKKSVKERSDRKISSEEESLSSVTIGSKSCVSSLTSDVSSFKEIRAHKLGIVAIVSHFYEIKPKVARRKRLKVNWSSGHQRTVVVAPPERRWLRCRRSQRREKWLRRMISCQTLKFL